ncbi:MAG: hypothetical protein [Arizlama microvirus]|nr:MAG: hypothetical protein [Arizlama microvirus]
MKEFRSAQEELNLLQLQNDLNESRRNARNVLRTIAGAVVLGILFLGAALVLSACEFVYLPECDYECQAGGGNDSYGKVTP